MPIPVDARTIMERRRRRMNLAVLVSLVVLGIGCVTDLAGGDGRTRTASIDAPVQP